MSKVIGRTNLEFLSRIKNYLENVFSGGFIENPQVEVSNRRGRFCQYDGCDNKRSRTDGVVKIRWDNGPVIYETYAFHSQCLKYLLKDERIPGIN